MSTAIQAVRSGVERRLDAARKELNNARETVYGFQQRIDELSAVLGILEREEQNEKKCQAVSGATEE